MQLLIMAIVIRNRINRRKEEMQLLHSLGMRRGKIVSVCMIEALRESVWCDYNAIVIVNGTDDVYRICKEIINL